MGDRGGDAGAVRRCTVPVSAILDRDTRSPEEPSAGVRPRRPMDEMAPRGKPARSPTWAERGRASVWVRPSSTRTLARHAFWRIVQRAPSRTTTPWRTKIPSRRRRARSVTRSARSVTTSARSVTRSARVRHGSRIASSASVDTRIEVSGPTRCSSTRRRASWWSSSCGGAGLRVAAPEGVTRVGSAFAERRPPFHRPSPARRLDTG